MASPSPEPPGRGRLGIGDVLSQLKEDFPDVSVSKLRFLETEGLVTPERTESGYRKFSTEDVARLRYILAAQRDHYYPLRVIKQHLDALERGLEPPAIAGQLARAPLPVPPTTEADQEAATTDGRLKLSREELAANSELDDDQLDQLIGYGLLRPRPGTDYFDAHALNVCRAAAQLASFGLEPRHLRPLKTAVDREMSLIDQVVSPVARQRTEAAEAQADELRRQLGDLCITLHAALVSSAVRAPYTT